MMASSESSESRMNENLPQCIKYWLTEANHDCYFVVGPEDGPAERIGAIKHILIGNSVPLRAMLQDSELAEKGDIRVTDTDPKTFRDFLTCVYGGSSILLPELTFEESAKLLYVIEKYLVNDVKTELTDHMKNLLSPENIFVALSHPIFYSAETSLKKEMLRILILNFEEITKNDQFLELSYAAIEWILQVPFFTVKEIEIWNAVLRWTKHKTDSSDGKILRSYMFGLLKYIRFLTMHPYVFWNSVVSSEILLDEEVNDICKAYVSGNPCSIEHLCSYRRPRYHIGLAPKNITSRFIQHTQCAFFHCYVSSVSDLQTYFQYSKTYHWAGYLWNVILDVQSVQEKDTLGVFVGCHGKTSNWNCEVDICIQLINQTGQHNDVSCSSRSVHLSRSQSSWGCPSFYEWNALLNPDNGFVKDNNIILVAKIQLKNI